jgi:predicted Rossmann fold nucleotide-binding protein DprA/Smf involved in DNA uptake
MKIGIVGNQEGWEYSFIRKKLIENHLTAHDIIISGGAKGVDTYAQMFAKEIGATIIIHYPDDLIPSPERYFIRNKQIATECDLLIAFDKKSGRAGTKNTIAHAKRLNKKIILYKVEE